MDNTNPAKVNQTQESQIQKVRSVNLDPFFSSTVINPDPLKFLDTLFKESISLGASDIFLEPHANDLLIRIRIDGVLYELGKISLEIYDQIVSKIKIMASLDPTERRKIQEGQITLEYDNKGVNLRIEIAQTANGEMIVARIHEKQTIIMKLSQLGFNDTAYKAFTNMVNAKSGLILVCGPTGCGKTTTLYSTVRLLNTNNSYNVMTIEDPIEFQLEGANQMQVQRDKDFSFAQGLKTILRLSPDIVLVGEIRDTETAKIAVESGLTGQLVLSTLHAEDSVGVLFRLLDLGIESYLLNSALTGVVSQRLVRVNCQSCKKAYNPNPDEVELFSKIMGRPPKTLSKSTGCENCGFLGFKGRAGIFEVLQITPSIRTMLRNKANETEVREALMRSGFITLLRDGLEKAEQGVTTIPEVLRNNIKIF